MSQRMIDLLILQYPGKTHLTAEETAKVLNQNPYTVRERMRNGELPKATKNNGIWEISIPDLAEIREPTKKAPQIPATPVVVGGARRRKAVVMKGAAIWHHRATRVLTPSERREKRVSRYVDRSSMSAILRPL